MPLAFIARESNMSQDQADSLFGILVTSNRIKWAALGVLLLLGLVGLVLAVVYYKKFKAAKESESLYSSNRRGDGQGLLDHVNATTEN